MTSNQIQNRANKEIARSNAAKERENYRSNLEKEKIGRESNRLTKRGQNLKLAGDMMNNLTRLASKGSDSALKVMGAANDPSWYNLDKSAVESAARISLKTPVGTVSKSGSKYWFKGKGTNTTPITKAQNDSKSGILTLLYTPAIGPQSYRSEGSPINAAAKNLYSFIRHANSGSRNYESPDYMLYLLAMDSLYTVYAEGVRLWRVLKTYSGENYFIGRQLTEALGYDYDDFMKNIAQFRVQLDLFKQRIAAFNVPHNFPFFDRHMWLSSNVFRDGDFNRAAMYCFRLKSYYLYDTVNGLLTNTPYYNELATTNFTGWVNHITNLLSVVELDEDIGLMSGDTLKAFGEDGVYKIGNIDFDSDLDIVYSLEVLEQITNATILPHISGGLTIGQDAKGNIVVGDANSSTHIITDDTYYSISLISGSTANSAEATKLSEEIIIDFSSVDPSPDNVMVASRLCAICSDIGLGADAEPRVKSCGSELIDAFRIVAIDSINEFKTYTGDGVWVMNAGAANSGGFTGYVEMFNLLCVWSQFDWAPSLDFAVVTAPSSTGTSMTCASLRDLHNWAVIGEDVLDNLHSVAIQSEFGIPLIGNRVR